MGIWNYEEPEDIPYKDDLTLLEEIHAAVTELPRIHIGGNNGDPKGTYVDGSLRMNINGFYHDIRFQGQVGDQGKLRLLCIWDGMVNCGEIIVRLVP